VNAAVTPVTFQGPVLSIRKPRRDAVRREDLVRDLVLPEEMLGMLEACVRARLNILVSGALGAGRTTLLEVLAGAIPEEQSILTVEQEAQLRLRQPRVMRLETRPPDALGRGEVSMRQLLSHGLLLRPDRVVVDELQGGEALDLLWAMREGLDGCLLGIHASGQRDAIGRLETLASLGDAWRNPRAIRQLETQTIQVLVHIARFRDGSRRVRNVTECVGLKREEVILYDLFVFQQTAAGPQGQVQGRFRGCRRGISFSLSGLSH
jgi:pilus assembly protein CpaF